MGRIIRVQPNPYGIYKSAKEILDAGMSTGDGVYTIYPDGVTAVQAYCDMTNDGGGWTFVMHKVASQWTTVNWGNRDTLNISNATNLNGGIFKFSDTIIKAIANSGNGHYKLSSYGTFNVTRYCKNCQYDHLGISADCNKTYADLDWNGLITGSLFNADLTGIGEYNTDILPVQSRWLMFVTGYKPNGYGGFTGSDVTPYVFCYNNSSNCNFRMWVR